jgi:FAD synthase
MITWYHSTVHHGDKKGRTISFPTVNLDPGVWPVDHQPGVYAAEVTIANHSFKGALYYGPRTTQSETHHVLEIFLLNFSQEIYGETISFRLHKFIRPVLHFNSFEELKAQIATDVLDVEKSFTNNLETPHDI